MFDRKVPCDEEASAVWDLRTKFLDYFDTANPAYKRARDFYPGDTQTMRSMELGTTFLSHKSPYELDADILRMNRLEKEAFRLGALQDVQNEIELSPKLANRAYKLMRNTRRRRLLRLTFPDGDKRQASFDVFMGNLNRETGMAVTEKAGMNSATAQLPEMIQTLRNDIFAGNNLSQDGLTGVLLSSLPDKSALAEDNELRSVTSGLARMLTAESPEDLKKILVDLERDGSIMNILNNVRFNNITPAFINQLTKLGIVGNQSGNLSGALGPGFLQNPLKDDQRPLA